MDDEGAVVTGEERRRLKRKYMMFKIPAYDAETRRFIGIVQDINEQGLQLSGVEVDVASTRRIIVQAADYMRTAPLHFVAECRWCRKETPDGDYVSGFEITAIAEEAVQNLRRLMKLVTLG
jgi:hypothetical protein